MTVAVLGVGAVYRATDTKLGREVAIKVLPAIYAQDSAWLARFRREARVLASLNHPNIAAIYGLEESDGPEGSNRIVALVMELVEGPTLRGPMPLVRALATAKQLAEALEYAHEKGIVHRDLKPANIKFTPEGSVKVLDFGLAKAVMPGISPEETLTATGAGAILGTPAYMAPEQASGAEVDRRADVWAFGVVLYEMLTGRRLFDGLERGEVDLRALPAEVRPVVERCLRRDPKLRWRSIGDVFLALEEGVPQLAPVRDKATPWVVALAVMTLLAVLAALGWWRATRAVEYSLTRLSLDLGPSAIAGRDTTVAIAPGDQRIVFSARTADGKQLLATRLLNQAQPTLLAGTENGSYPFFSPDGQWIGFFASDKLKKIPVTGGVPVTLYERAMAPTGASWGEDGNVVLALGYSTVLSRLPSSGGMPQPLTKLGADEVTHRFPQVLPGGNAVLFTASPNQLGMEDANIEVVSLKTGQMKVVQHGGYYGRYLPSGHLVYVHQGALFAVGFDLQRLEARGAPVPVLDDVAANPIDGGGQFDFSSGTSGHGILAYRTGKFDAEGSSVAWLDSSGKVQPLLAGTGAFDNPRFSPDGRRLALQVYSAGADIFIYDLERNTTTRLTFGGHSSEPLWSPDGKHMAFRDAKGLAWMRSDGVGASQSLLKGENVMVPWSFSPDGRRLAYFETNPSVGWNNWTVPIDSSDPDHPKAGKPEPILPTSANGVTPRFSPDGRWIAYRSDESGRNEIYVRPAPGGRQGKWQISNGGGRYPIWSPNGRELFYLGAGRRVWVANYTVNGDSFVPGAPRIWSETPILFRFHSPLDLAPDGKRFALLTPPKSASNEGPVHVTVLENFFDELKRKLAAGN